MVKVIHQLFFLHLNKYYNIHSNPILKIKIELN